MQSVFYPKDEYKRRKYTNCHIDNSKLSRYTDVSYTYEGHSKSSKSLHERGSLGK